MPAKVFIQNSQTALEWYRKAARQGNAHAQYSLGFAYYSGNGVSRNFRQAALWFREAALQGLPEALMALGTAYTYGQGVPRNHIAAYALFSQAAARGLDTQNALSTLSGAMTPEQINQAQSLDIEDILK